MERTINDSLAQLTRKSQAGQRVDKDGRILFVNYSNHSIVVKVNGYGVIKGVMVRKGIVLGTTDRQVVVQGDWATIHQKETGRWVCTGIERKVKCAIPMVQTDEVIVDTDTEFDTSNSYIQQLDSSFQLPDDLRLPPIEQLGQITLPAFRFPDTSTFLCGMPPCTDCGTPTVGMFIQISSDAEHPLCYKYSFRPGVGDIWVFYAPDIVYQASYVASTPKTPVAQTTAGIAPISPSIANVSAMVLNGFQFDIEFYHTTDRGSTWTLVHTVANVNSPAPNDNILVKPKPDKTNTLLDFFNSSVYNSPNIDLTSVVSNDGGSTWSDTVLESISNTNAAIYVANAPFHNGSDAYVIFSIETPTVVADYYERIHKIDSSGASLGAISISTPIIDPGGSDIPSHFTTAEVDPTDTDSLYVITRQEFLGESLLLKVSYSGAGYTTLTAPYDTANDFVDDLLFTDAGTLLIPVKTAAGGFMVYRSTDQGASFGSIDLSAYVGAGFSTPPIGRIVISAVENILLSTDLGYIIYSTDDGVTWNVSGAVLPTDSPTDIDG